jgi:hypothetical protein
VVCGQEQAGALAVTEREQDRLEQRAVAEVEAGVDIVGGPLHVRQLRVAVQAGQVPPLQHQRDLGGRIVRMPLPAALLESHAQGVVVSEQRAGQRRA